MNSQTTEKPSKKKYLIIFISVLIVAVFLFSPLLFYGLKTGMIGLYPGNVVESKINGMSPRPSQVKSGPNGDILTGTGTYYEYFPVEHYSSPREAIEDTVKDLQSSGLPAPSYDQIEKPDSVSFESHEGVFNGSTVGVIRIGYYFDKGDISIIYTLDSEINCDDDKEELVVCEDDRFVESIDGLGKPFLSGKAVIGGDINALI